MRTNVVFNWELYRMIAESKWGQVLVILELRDKQGTEETFKAYLNMAPGRNLKWQGVTVLKRKWDEGTEPHSQILLAGETWVDNNRDYNPTGFCNPEGDVAGRCPTEICDEAQQRAKTCNTGDNWKAKALRKNFVVCVNEIVDSNCLKYIARKRPKQNDFWRTGWYRADRGNNEDYGWHYAGGAFIDYQLQWQDGLCRWGKLNS